MAPQRILLYLMRRDLRIQDNKILTNIRKAAQRSYPPFTHLLPLYIFHPGQIEVSGLLKDGVKSPFPEARSRVAQFWRCGPHRAKWLAESIWDVKKSLEGLGSGLEIRVGRTGVTVKNIITQIREQGNEVTGLWLHHDWTSEEQSEQNAVKHVLDGLKVEFKAFDTDAYFVDDADVPCKPAQLPDVFTQYKNKVMPLRDTPRSSLPPVDSLPPLPSNVPAQADPFEIPDSLEALIGALQKPLADVDIKNPPALPKNAKSAHPFTGGETTGSERIKQLLKGGHMTDYKDTRNGMLGLNFSTKLSAWLAHGCITARQIHWAMYDFEEGQSSDPEMKRAKGFGKGENKGTAAVRFELLWRDYMNQCARKFGTKMFHESGLRDDTSMKWRYPKKDGKDEVSRIVDRFLNGTTGLGLIDASQRELYLTGYTSNRARQNVASFLAKHMGVDWRIGAEWYECMLIDYDTSSNWLNWSYVAGVGNDPRGEARVFNPVKQAHDYDPGADYIKNWIEPLRKVTRPEHAMQPWTMSEEERKHCGVEDEEWVMSPLKKIEFKKGAGGGRGRGGGGGGGGGYRGSGRGGGDRRDKRGGFGKGGRGGRQTHEVHMG